MYQRKYSEEQDDHLCIGIGSNMVLYDFNPRIVLNMLEMKYYPLDPIEQIINISITMNVKVLCPLSFVNHLIFVNEKAIVPMQKYRIVK